MPYELFTIRHQRLRYLHDGKTLAYTGEGSEVNLPFEGETEAERWLRAEMFFKETGKAYELEVKDLFPTERRDPKGKTTFCYA